MTPKEKHLEMIQTIITRMNTNSFQIKGFTIALVTGIIAAYAATKNPWMIGIAYPPIIIFWILDSYYLQQERKFRGLYNEITEGTINTNYNDFQMPIGDYKGGEYTLLSSMFVSVNCFIYLAVLAFFIVFSCVIS